MERVTEWNRQPGESDKAFDAFRRYLALGPERSVETLRRNLEAEGIRKSNRMLQIWSVDWRWVERCKAHADHLAAIENASRAKVREEWAAKWERRRMEAAARNWASAKLLRRKAEEMLAWPLAEEKSEDGVTVKKPVKWGMSAAAAMLKTSAELQAEALAEALGETDDFDPTTATPEELKGYLQREGLMNADGEMKPMPRRRR